MATFSINASGAKFATNKTSKTDVALWCYITGGLGGFDGMDFWVKFGAATVLIR